MVAGQVLGELVFGKVSKGNGFVTPLQGVKTLALTLMMRRGPLYLCGIFTW